MITFSINNYDPDYQLRVYKTVCALEKYFLKVCGGGVDHHEVMQRAIIHACNNRDSKYTNLEPYIKTLARTLPKTRNNEIAYSPLESDKEEEIKENPLLTTGTYDEYPIFVESADIRNSIQDLYLVFPKDMIAIRDSVMSGSAELKISRYLSRDFMNQFTSLRNKYDGRALYSFLKEFYEKLDKTSAKIVNNVKEIKLKEPKFKYLSKLQSDVFIVSMDGKRACINKETLLTEEFEPDYVRWSLYRVSAHVYKIDISPVIDYSFKNVAVAGGIDTKLVKWCGARKLCRTLGGASILNVDLDKYIDLIYRELFVNLLMNGYFQIVAASKDSIYIKEKKRLTYDTLRIITSFDKAIDCEVIEYRQATGR
jgi:hypothetical protein